MNNACYRDLREDFFAFLEDLTTDFLPVTTELFTRYTSAKRKPINIIESRTNTPSIFVFSKYSLFAKYKRNKPPDNATTIKEAKACADE